MDYLRSCYTVDMVFRDGDPPRKVQWYFTDDAKAWPFMHAFASANWVSKEVVSGDLGEQPGPRVWVNGSRPINAGAGDDKAVECAGLRKEWFQTGLPIGEDGGPWDVDGLPECCTNPTPPPPEPCDSCDDIPTSLLCTFSCPDCPCLDGAEFVIEYDIGLNRWVANGLTVCDCDPPGFGAISMYSVDEGPPCVMEFDFGILFCGGGGLPDASPLCDEDGLFVSLTFEGTFNISTGACTSKPYTVVLTEF